MTGVLEGNRQMSRKCVLRSCVVLCAKTPHAITADRYAEVNLRKICCPVSANSEESMQVTI